MFWRPGRGEYPGKWHGPGRVIIQESEHVIWVSHSSKIFRVAPEHVRKLSEREASSCLDQLASEPLQVPPRVLGKGVFQYEDLTEQVIPVPPHMPPPPSPPNVSISENASDQPDAEPEMPSQSNSSDYAPSTPLNDLPDSETMEPSCT